MLTVRPMDSARGGVSDGARTALAWLRKGVKVAFMAGLTTTAGAAEPQSHDPHPGFLEQYAATYRFRLGRPTEIKVTPDGDAVLFLRSGPRSFAQDLYAFDVATRREHVLLTAAQVLHGAAEKLSAEERAHRERMRVAARGIVSYQLSEDGRRILVPLAGRLFVVERASGAVRELKGSPGFPLDPQFSPDGTKVACVRDDDLYVIDLDTGHERRLTTGASDTLSHGLAEFVAQEEMGRFSGFWWSPDSRSIAYQETNEAHVDVLHIQDPAHPEQSARAVRYPRPGRPNAEVGLGIVPAEGGPTTWVHWDRAHYPYLATVRWSRNAPLTVLVQNRRQTEEALLGVDEASGSTHTLLVEQDPEWLNLDPKMPRWLADGSGFLWTTERRGAWQLELRHPDGTLARELTAPSFAMYDFLDLDDATHVAWVHGGADPTERQLVRVPLDPGRSPEQVTHTPGRHDAVFARHFQVAVRSWSGLDRAPSDSVVDANGAPLGMLHAVTEAPAIHPHLQFTTVGARGYHAVIITPENFRAGARYPVLVSVYGGPHVQVVMKSAWDFLLQQWFADHGFIVVSFDGRGTPGRGRAWERAIKNDLAAIPLVDQVDALHALAADHPEMDLSRVGIYGWSFGGYFSAMAAMRKPDVFRAAVVGAPVVDWHDYDTHYTERYMDLPERNAAGYEAASVLTYAPTLERPLLLIHGTVDDNVYFVNSMKLVDALFRAGRPFEFLPLAGYTHMVPNPVVVVQLEHRIAEFFVRHLAAGGRGDATSHTSAP